MDECEIASNDIGRNMWCSMSDSYREAEKKMFLRLEMRTHPIRN